MFILRPITFISENLYICMTYYFILSKWEMKYFIEVLLCL